jgi:hypothetical protein
MNVVVSIFLCEGDRVVAIPGIEDGLFSGVVV